MLSFDELATGADFTAATVTCRDDHTGWSQVESSADYRVILVHRGWFRRRTTGAPAEVDPTLAYVGVPGEEERFAHPAGGDVCTSVRLTPQLWRVLAGDTARPARSTVYVDPRLDLAHRRFLAAARSTDLRGADGDHAAAEHLVGLLGRVIEQVVTGPTPSAAARDDHALVATARRAIGDDHPAAGGLFPLAELLGVSPYRLSRSFTRELGVSLTRYRNRVRLGRALDRLERGEASLAVLAADLGFADQAHLTRTMTEQLGHTPTALRRLLSRSPVRALNR